MFQIQLMSRDIWSRDIGRNNSGLCGHVGGRIGPRRATASLSGTFSVNQTIEVVEGTGL